MLNVREIGIDELKPWESNPRDNDTAVDAVARSISSFGFNVPILCDASLTIVAGHTRWKAARKLGLTQVPAIVLDLSDTQRRAFAVADNKTAEVAEWDIPKLRDILSELREEEVDLENLGYSGAELRKILFDDTLEDALPELSEKTLTRVGDLWVLGTHRLFCGNSADDGALAVLAEGRQVDHVFAGPPCFNQKGLGCWDSYPAYLQSMRQVMLGCLAALRDGSVLVWNIGNGSADGHDHSGHHSVLLEDCGLRYLDTIVWKKTGANFSIPRNCHIRRNRLYYPAFGWEALLVYQKPGDMPKMSEAGLQYMASYQTNVWEISAVTRQLEQYGHPGVCPVEVPYRTLLAYTIPGATVLDPFGGSGTTLIAAEQTGREALLMEVSPRFCDMAVKRWEGFTGKKAARLNS